MAEINQDLAEKIALSAHILAWAGHSDKAFGHVSARLPGQEYLHMTPYGLGLEDVGARDICLIDREGNNLYGARCPREYPIHTEIYRIRAEVNCVIHTHPPQAIIVSASGGKLRPISHEGALFSDLPLFMGTSGLILTAEQGKAVAMCLGQARAALLQNHGIVAAGRSVEEATVYAVLLEKAARMELTARQFAVQSWSSEEESRLKVEQVYSAKNMQNIWEYLIRRVGKTKKERTLL
jgi:ribulose-5-phosphate 4-epimerase/fuculose-1-phosphate aldolase